MAFHDPKAGDFDAIARIVSEEYARRLAHSGERYPLDGVPRPDVAWAAYSVLNRYGVRVDDPAAGVSDRELQDGIRYADLALDYLASVGLLEPTGDRRHREPIHK